MRKISIICTVVFLGCLLALPAIGYLGGRQCMPLIVWPLFPAEIVPLAIGFVTAILLIVGFIVSLMTGRNRQWTMGALAVVGTIGVFFLCTKPTTVFLYGLRDGFRARVGYPTMRQFAREISQDNSLIDADGVLYPPSDDGTASPAQQKQWNDLVARYPFLGWNGGSRTISRHGSVQLYWGSALTGHWGFEVTLEGTLSVSEEDRGEVLIVADDIQFVCYYD